jgi:Zn-dependent alcohol dehydrogenase
VPLGWSSRASSGRRIPSTPAPTIHGQRSRVSRAPGPTSPWNRAESTAGRVVRGIVEGDSVPDVFIPRLIELWRQGRFPVERLISTYDFDQIDEAAHQAEDGQVIKAVVKM